MTLSPLLATVSAFFVAVALFYAPLAYGCTRPDMLPALFLLLIFAIITGAWSLYLSRGDRPALPKLVLLCVGAILVQGWWLALNPTFAQTVSTNGGLVHTTLEQIRQRSLASMTITSLLLPVFVVLCGLFNDPHPRRFILLGVAGSGILISVCGVVLKLVGDPLMVYVWKPSDIDWNDFAFYRYHANAGAFLNLTWPLILVFTRRAYTTSDSWLKIAMWTLASLACGGGLFLNASKSSLVIGLIILPLAFSTGLMRMKARSLLMVVGCAIFCVAGGMLLSSKLAREAAFQRMTNVNDVSASFDGRWAAYQEYLDAVPEVGCFGLGPGLFPIAFPYQSSPLGNTSTALRDYAHEDYLQGLLEWGWLGTAWWFLLVAGGLFRAVKTYRQRELFPSKTDRHLVLAAILGLSGTLAQALIDFPLQIVSIRLVFFVLLAFCWASPQLLTAPVREAVPRMRYRLPIPAEYAKSVTTNSR